MVELKNVSNELMDSVLGLLQSFQGAYFTTEQWKKILNYDWGQNEDYYGFALVDNNNVVGFLGLIFSVRMIGNKRELFCNLSSWIVKDEYRNHALKLLYPVLKMRNYTITNFTSFKEGVDIMKRFGFVSVDSFSRIILTGPLCLKSNKCHVLKWDDNSCIYLPEYQKQMARDHFIYGCESVIMKNNEQQCLIIMSQRMKAGVRYYYVHYISDIHLFLDNIGVFRAWLFWHRRAACFVIDERFMRSKAIFMSYSRKLPSPRLVKNNNNLMFEQIDSLYSELIILR